MRLWNLSVPVLALVTLSLAAQVAERNVNMVAGTGWPGGDPFLQRQNEPSLAVSSRNPLHLLAGANDYRTVDIPGIDGTETGDAWLGVFQSGDGGLSWQSTLLPGYPQEISSTSPLKGYDAASDPVVRAGSDGIFYYAGIGVKRQTNGPSCVFVSRFVDDNVPNAANSIRYLDTKVIATATNGDSIDKPWLAVDPSNSRNLYLAYTLIDQDSPTSVETAIMFVRSNDGGATWGKPVELVETYSINQGVSIAVDPRNGRIALAWRRFQVNTEGGSILFALSSDGGKAFKTVTVASPPLFDQGTTSRAIRTRAYPTVAVDDTGRIFVAWSQRGFGPAPNGVDDARVVITSSSDGVNWSTPAPIEPVSLFAGRGHQFMPSLTFGHGRLALFYYDQRFDSTYSTLDPLTYQLVRHDDGDRLAGGTLLNVFNRFLSDTPYVKPDGTTISPLLRRHSLEVRVASAPSSVMPAFRSTQVSSYRFGISNNHPGEIRQVEFNVPNLTLFRKGTVPFLGDYIDIRPSTASGVFHAVWTDNRDVVPPRDGNWSNYTPVRSAALGTSSLFDGSSVQPCSAAGQGGMRNQNIYTARISDGIVAGAPVNARLLDTTTLRSFVVFVRNSTAQTKQLTLSITAPPAVLATFDPKGNPLSSLPVSVPPFSTAARSVFARALTTVASGAIVVGISESGGTSAAQVVLNSDTSYLTAEPPEILNGEIQNGEIQNGQIVNGDIQNGEIVNAEIQNGEIQNAEIQNAEIQNAEIQNGEIQNGEIQNGEIQNGSLTDTTWTALNQGNTATSYTVKLASTSDVPAGIAVQLIVWRESLTPAERDCQLVQERQIQLLTAMPAQLIRMADIQNGEIQNGEIQNTAPSDATLWLPPGGAARVTVRVIDSNPEDASSFDASSSVVPILVSHTTATARVGLVVATTSLPSGRVGEPYAASLAAVGGNAASYQWSIPNGALPAGLTLSPNGSVSGTPASAGVTQFVADVVDASGLHARRLLDIGVSTTGTHSGDTFNAVLTAAMVNGHSPYSWAIDGGALPSGLTLSSDGVLSGTSSGAGMFHFTAQVTNSRGEQMRAPLSLTVSPYLTFDGQPLIEIFACSGTPADPPVPALCADFRVTPQVSVFAHTLSGTPLAGMPVHLSLGGNSSAHLNGATDQSTDASGHALFSQICVDQQGTYSLQATSFEERVNSNSFSVGPGNPTGTVCNTQ